MWLFFFVVFSFISKIAYSYYSSIALLLSFFLVCEQIIFIHFLFQKGTPLILSPSFEAARCLFFFLDIWILIMKQLLNDACLNVYFFVTCTSLFVMRWQHFFVLFFVSILLIMQSEKPQPAYYARKMIYTTHPHKSME